MRAWCRRRTVAPWVMAWRWCSASSTMHDDVDDVLDEIMNLSEESASAADNVTSQIDSVQYGAERESNAEAGVGVTFEAFAAAADERRVLGDELVDLQRKQARAAFVPQPAAKAYLTAAELIADGAAQQFCSPRDPPDTLPQLRACGSVAMVSLVGTVQGEVYTKHVVTRSESECAASSDGDNGDYEEFFVRYCAPLESMAKQSLRVRCYGGTLRAYVRRNVRAGVVVHVLGCLVSAHAAEECSAHCAVHVMPIGGNVSVIAQGM